MLRLCLGKTSFCGDVVLTVYSVHMQTAHGHRVPWPGLAARSGATTVVLWQTPHAKFYGRGVYFVWLAVLCTLLIDC